ncbi:MAG: hypothetical protein UHK60_01710 [Acutalibacteraceae bacterium]|nr:hypothetical protein [Acutalibacteraceae bacterium]
MNNNFFESNYPQITQLYYDYINSNAYAKHPITSSAEYDTSKAIDQALEELKHGREIQACDILTSGLATYEHGGFILGFSLAMSLIQEGTANKTP